MTAMNLIGLQFCYKLSIQPIKLFNSRSFAEHSTIWIFCAKWLNEKSFPCLPKKTSSRLDELSTDCKRLERVVRMRFLYKKKKRNFFKWLNDTIPIEWTYNSFSNKFWITTLPLAIVSSCLLHNIKIGVADNAFSAKIVYK